MGMQFFNGRKHFWIWEGRGWGWGEASELHCDPAVETSHVVFTIVHLNCTWKKKVECLKHHKSAQGICQSEIKWDGKRVLQNKGTNAPFAAACVYVWVREYVWDGEGGRVSGRVWTATFFCSFFVVFCFCFVFLLIYSLECDNVMNSHIGEETVTNCYRCLKLCTKLSDQICFWFEK